MRRSSHTWAAVAATLIANALALVAVPYRGGATRAVRVPGAPTALRVVRDPGAIQVFFEPPLSDGGGRIQKYRVNVFPSDSSHSSTFSHYCFASGCVLPLVARRLVRVDVVAVNAAGTGAPSPLTQLFMTYPIREPSSRSGFSPRVWYTANWAGYVVTKGSFTDASAQFVVPAISCTNRATELSQWVGIGGAGINFLEQDGVNASCTNGSATYYAFYEMFGDAQVSGGGVVELQKTVHPGDVMVAAVRESRNRWHFRLNDVTGRWVFTTAINSPLPTTVRPSADFIVEGPLYTCSEGFPCVSDTLPDFTKAAFSNISLTDSKRGPGAIPSTPNTYAMTIVNSGTSLAVPSQLGENGTSFQVSPPPQLLNTQPFTHSSGSEFTLPEWRRSS